MNRLDVSIIGCVFSDTFRGRVAFDKASEWARECPNGCGRTLVTFVYPRPGETARCYTCNKEYGIV